MKKFVINEEFLQQIETLQTILKNPPHTCATPSHRPCTRTTAPHRHRTFAHRVTLTLHTPDADLRIVNHPYPIATLPCPPHTCTRCALTPRMTQVSQTLESWLSFVRKHRKGVANLSEKTVFQG